MTYPHAIFISAAMIAAGLVLAGTSALSGGRYDQCETTVADRLAELNIAQADAPASPTCPSKAASAVPRAEGP